MRGIKVGIITLCTVIAGWAAFASLGIEPSRSGAQTSNIPEPSVKPVQKTCTPGGPKFFVVGVWMVPPSHMRAWKDRGANTVLSIGDGIDPKVHDASARSLSLNQIRTPLQTLDKDLFDTS